MLTIRIPAHLLFDCQRYLEHNGQYPNREYYLRKDTDSSYELSFGGRQNYLAFCYYWSKIIL